MAPRSLVPFVLRGLTSSAGQTQSRWRMSRPGWWCWQYGGSLPPLPMGAPTHSRCVILKRLQPPWYLAQREVRGPQQTVCPACRGTASLASRELPPCPRPELPMPWVLDPVGTGPQLPPHKHLGPCSWQGVIEDHSTPRSEPASVLNSMI